MHRSISRRRSILYYTYSEARVPSYCEGRECTSIELYNQDSFIILSLDLPGTAIRYSQDPPAAADELVWESIAELTILDRRSIARLHPLAEKFRYRTWFVKVTAMHSKTFHAGAMLAAASDSISIVLLRGEAVCRHVPAGLKGRSKEDP